MWSNTAPDGGLILVGVSDDGSITGCKSLDPKDKNTLEQTHVYCPDARASSREVRVRNLRGEEDYILVFRVPYREDKLVLTSTNKAFFRQGSSKYEMTDDVKREHRISKGEIHHELETVALDYPSDFDQEQVQKFCEAYRISKRIRQDRSSEEVLELARLGRRTSGGFKANLAGCLLLANDPRMIVPGSYIRIIRYDGSSAATGERHNSVFNEIVDGPIAKMIDLAKERVSSQIKLFQRLNASGRLERKPEYPEGAWLEAIVNAIAHRSYNLKTQPVFIKLFTDRMQVESPGGFVPPVTAETIYETHAPRNPNLMEAMWHLGFTFMNREGTTRMKEEMIAASLPEPKFSQGDNYNFRVTVSLENNAKLRSGAGGEEFAGLSEDVYIALSHEERTIVNYLSVNPGLTVGQAAALIERSDPTATKYLNALVQKSIINPFLEGSTVVRPRTYSLKKPT